MALPTAYIAAGVDFGTSGIRIAFRAVKENHLTEIYYVRADGKNIDTTAQAAYYDKKFYWGYDLQQHVNNTKWPFIPSEYVIKLAKLNLYYDDVDEGTAIPSSVPTVNEQLREAGKTLDDLLRDYMKGIKELVMQEAVNSKCTYILTGSDKKSLTVRMRLSAPEMWSPVACSRMVAACKAAGVDVVTVVSEPQAALAHLLDLFTQRGEKPVQNLLAGDIVLVVDPGCGTGDFVLYELEDDLSVTCRLRPVSKSRGAICGSQQINEILIRRLKSVLGSKIKDECARLQITKHYFWHQIEEQLGRVKQDFDGRPFYHVAVDPEAGVSEVSFSHRFTRAEVKDAFDRVIRNNTAQMDPLVQERQPQLISVVGGFGRSGYLMDVLKRRYHKPGTMMYSPWDFNDGENSSVCTGCLSQRYERIKPQHLPARRSYALLQVEYYDDSLHHDAYSVQPLRSSGRGIMQVKVPKDNIAMPSENDPNELIVHNRLVIFLTKDVVSNEDEFGVTALQEYFPDVEDPVLSATFVTIDRDGYSDHDPALDEDGCYRPGIQLWKRVEVRIDKDKLRSQRFPTTINTLDQEVYKLEAALIIKYCGEKNMTVGFKIKGPRRGRDLTVYEETAVLWDANSSEWTESPDNGQNVSA